MAWAGFTSPLPVPVRFYPVKVHVPAITSLQFADVHVCVCVSLMLRLAFSGVNFVPEACIPHPGGEFVREACVVGEPLAHGSDSVMAKCAAPLPHEFVNAACVAGDHHGG